MLRIAAYLTASFSDILSDVYFARASAAPSISLSRSMPATAIGKSPTGVRTENLPPTSSGITNVS